MATTTTTAPAGLNGNGSDPASLPAPRLGHVRRRRAASVGEAQARVLLAGVARAARVGLVLRSALFAVAILAAIVAVLYTALRADAIVDLGRLGDGQFLERIVILTLPVVILIVLVVVAVAGAAVLQSRAIDERERALDAINRIQREAEDGVSRARSLSRLAQDELVQMRREFLLQVWFGRSAFLVAAVLIGVAVVYSVAEGELDWWSVGVGAGGFAAWALGTVADVPGTVACRMAALAQRQVIVTGFVREVGMVEAAAYRALAAKGTGLTMESGALAAEDIHRATDRAIRLIEVNCKPARGGAVAKEG